MGEELQNVDIVEEVIEEIPEETIEQVTEEPQVKEDKPDERVPLSVLLEEKKRRKELERRLRDLEDKELESDLLLEKRRVKQRYVDKGYNEDLAELLAEDHASLKHEMKKTLAHKDRKDFVDEELEDLSRDSFYSDAKAYSKEIKAKISEFKTKGIEINVEDAYNLVRNPKIKMKEIKEDEEQKALIKKREEPKATIPNASASNPKNPYPLDDVDKKALANLQKAQPHAGWTAEKYYKIRYSK